MRRTSVLLVFLGLLATGCPAEPATPEPPAGAIPAPGTRTEPIGDSSLRWAINEPTAIVPIDAVTGDDILVVDALYDSLTSWTDDLTTEPAVATRWTATEGGRVWRFHLRPDAAFHDGTPVTAQHFVDTWNVMAARGAGHHHLRDVEGYQAVREGAAEGLTGLRAVSPLTLEVGLGRALYEWPAVAAHPALAPMLQLERPSRQQPIGNGPFKITEPWAPGRFIRLTRAGPPPDVAEAERPLDEVVFQVLDPSTAYLAFEQGRVDVAPLPPGAFDRERFATSSRYAGPGLLRGPLPTTYFLLVDTARPPFDRVSVRRSLAMAVDRRSMAANAFSGSAGPAVALMPAVIPGGRQRTCLACVYSPSDARRGLRAAGVQELSLWVSEGGDHERVAARVQGDLAAAGVRVRIRVVPFDRFRAALASREPGVYRFGWTPDYPTMDNALRPLLHSAATPQRGGANHSRYADPGVDRLLDRAAATPDADVRTTLYQRAEDLALGRDQALVPVVVPRRSTVVAERVRGLVYSPMGTANLSDVRIVDRD